MAIVLQEAMFEVAEKRCCHCHQVKPLTEFCRHRRLPTGGGGMDGLARDCRACQSEAGKRVNTRRALPSKIFARSAADSFLLPST